MSRLTLGVFMIATWVLLWGDLSVANVLSGAAIVVLLFVVFPSDRPVWPRTGVHPVALVALLAHFARELVVSNLVLAREIISPRVRLEMRIVDVPLRTTSRPLLTLITNITALTPGMMTVAVRSDPPVVTLHVIDLRGATDVAASLRRLEARCVRAFGTAESIAELTGTPAQRPRGAGARK